MGLLDRWSKKTTKTQLDEATKVEKKEDKVEEKSTKTSSKATTKKTTKTAKAVVAEKADNVVAEKVKVSSVGDKVLLRPLVTEKAAIAGSHNQYGFIVARGTNKIEIKKAVEEVYGVKPAAVNVINVSGKEVRFGRSSGRRSDYKKALVTLPQGKSINIHEGV